MPAQLSAWLDHVMALIAGLETVIPPWPVLPIALVFAVALIEAVVLPRRLWAKGVWVLVVVLCGGLAAAGIKSEEQRRLGASGNELAALKGLWDQWDRVSQTLPAAGDKPAASFDTEDNALAALSAQVSVVERQIAALKQQPAGRTIATDTAAKLADYLRQYAGYPIVVSCVPGDVEAYDYATQLVNILKAAGWDARGPEITSVLADASAMGVVVFVRDPRAPDAAKILLDAFTRFNIPSQSGIAEDDNIPDTATVELFVAKKP
jgi:hypothetical protein